jgi:hypothetical protein
VAQSAVDWAELQPPGAARQRCIQLAELRFELAPSGLPAPAQRQLVPARREQANEFPPPEAEQLVAQKL